MLTDPNAPGIPLLVSKRNWLTPHGIALIAMWLFATVAFVIMLYGGVRDTGQFPVERDLIQVAYVLALSWYLIRTGPAVKQPPDAHQVWMPRWRFGKFIPAILIALVFVGELYDQGLLLPLMMLATLWMLIARWREIRFRTVLQGLAITVVAGWAGWAFYQNQYINEVIYFGLLAFVTPMFVAGDLLSKRTGLVGSQLYTGRYRQAVRSLLWGCLLFVPLGLSDAASGSPGAKMNWVKSGWMVFTQPGFSGMVEEVWYRLLLVSLCYFLLRSALNKRLALACAVLFSAITFGLGHGGTFQDRFLMIGLLYGLPMAIIFARRDWEHTAGAHYMVNMIPTLMVFLEV